MTVIVYRDGVMAGDGRTRSMKDFIEEDDAKKVFKLKDGCLVGFAGDVPQSLELHAALKDAVKKGNKNLPVIALPKCEAILAEPNGTLWWFGGKLWEKMTTKPFYALGTGYALAVGAMEAGADAVTAVKIACKRLSSCGGKITVVKL